jgi:hypothetical protein
MENPIRIFLCLLAFFFMTWILRSLPFLGWSSSESSSPQNKTDNELNKIAVVKLDQVSSQDEEVEKSEEPLASPIPGVDYGNIEDDDNRSFQITTVEEKNVENKENTVSNTMIIDNPNFELRRVVRKNPKQSLPAINLQISLNLGKSFLSARKSDKPKSAKKSSGISEHDPDLIKIFSDIESGINQAGSCKESALNYSITAMSALMGRNFTWDLSSDFIQDFFLISYVSAVKVFPFFSKKKDAKVPMKRALEVFEEELIAMGGFNKSYKQNYFLNCFMEIVYRYKELLDDEDVQEITIQHVSQLMQFFYLFYLPALYQVQLEETGEFYRNEVQHFANQWDEFLDIWDFM